jgi:GTPase
MIDTASIKIKAGDGGDGLVSFRREKYIPKGGPWGGDGGRGGNIIFLVDDHINTLSPFRRKRHYEAENGQNGMKKNMKGKDGDDLVIVVPRGTVIKDEDGKVIHDLTEDGQEVIVLQGGNGGLGNWHFKSSVNQTPRIATQGKPGKEKLINLELKLIADVGLVGFPSSGKSTLLNSLSNTNVKTASYHFTTLEPNLGVLEVSGNEKDIVIADLPGLIEGAAEGKGLGHEFLRHVERTKVIIHLIDGSELLYNKPEKLIENYKAIRNELNKWNPELLKKPEIAVVNKSDLIEVREKSKDIIKLFNNISVNVSIISAYEGTGLKELINDVIELVELHKSDKMYVDLVNTETAIFNLDTLRNRRIIFKNKLKEPNQDKNNRFN